MMGVHGCANLSVFAANSFRWADDFCQETGNICFKVLFGKYGVSKHYVSVLAKILFQMIWRVSWA